jgi:hypothetical protein
MCQHELDTFSGTLNPQVLGSKPRGRTTKWLANRSATIHAVLVKLAWLVAGLAAVGLGLVVWPDGDSWFAITDASASSAASSMIRVGVDGCAPTGQPPVVVETDTEVRLSVRQRHGGDEAACLSSFQITLAAPIGKRKVIDVRHHSEVPLTLALPFTMPAPTWLPEGWKLHDEAVMISGVESTYGAPNAPGWSFSVTLTSDTTWSESFRAATVEATTTVQGRAAIWTHSTDQPDVPALIVQDATWTLIVQELHADLGRERLERIANSLTPFPFAETVAAPVLPPAWTGPVADVLGREGKAVITGWLVIDGNGAATICDTLNQDGTGCTGPTMTVDWATAYRTPPTDLVTHGDVRVSGSPVRLSGSAKVDIFFVGI